MKIGLGTLVGYNDLSQRLENVRQVPDPQSGVAIPQLIYEVEERGFLGNIRYAA